MNDWNVCHVLEYLPVPASYNFHSQSGCFVGIMDQGQCGSCYAFSTAAAASDRLCLAQSTKRVLSPQEILDCGKGKAWFGNVRCGHSSDTTRTPAHRTRTYTHRPGAMEVTPTRPRC